MSSRIERPEGTATDARRGSSRALDTARTTQPPHSPDMSSQQAPEYRTPQALTGNTYADGAMCCLKKLCRKEQPRNPPEPIPLETLQPQEARTPAPPQLRPQALPRRAKAPATTSRAPLGGAKLHTGPFRKR